MASQPGAPWPPAEPGCYQPIGSANNDDGNEPVGKGSNQRQPTTDRSRLIRSILINPYICDTSAISGKLGVVNWYKSTISDVDQVVLTTNTCLYQPTNQPTNCWRWGSHTAWVPPAPLSQTTAAGLPTSAVENDPTKNGWWYWPTIMVYKGKMFNTIDAYTGQSCQSAAHTGWSYGLIWAL